MRKMIKMKMTPIKGMARGYEADLYYSVTDEVILIISTPTGRNGLICSLSFMHKLKNNNNDELLQKTIVYELKDFINQKNLRRIPNEQELNDTADLLMAKVSQKYRDQISLEDKI